MKLNSILSVLTLVGSMIFASSVIAKDVDDIRSEKKEDSLSKFSDELKSAVKNGEMSKEEAIAKYRKALASGTIESLEKNQEDESLLTLNGFFLGGQEDDDGQYQASFIIQSKSTDKSEWPRITFTGERVESQFRDLEKRDAILINLGEGTAKKVAGEKGGKKKGKFVAMRKGGGDLLIFIPLS